MKSPQDHPSDAPQKHDQAPDVHAPPTKTPGNAVPEATVITSRPPIGDPALVGRVTPRVMGESLVGTMLSHFRLEEFVGGGGMGAVFRAVDTMLDRTVAVKVLSRSQSVDHENVKRFKNEAQSAARLDNENIARVYYVSEDEGWNFIVFEFIEGQNVRDIVAERGPLPLDEAISYVVQVCDALEHASARDVVHRDIKPSNILVTPQGRAKLVDMGLARLHHVQSGEDDLTASGVTLGTFDYISPEQARDPRSADVRSDLYSLGCSLFYMLTGRPPFPEGTVLQKLLQHSGDAPPDIRQFRGDVPDEIVDILGRLLEKQPSQRYQRPANVARHLLQTAETHGIAIPWRSTFTWMHDEPALRTWANRLLPWFVPLGLLLGGVLLLDWSLPSGDAESSVPSFDADDAAYQNDPVPNQHDSMPLAPHVSRSGNTSGIDVVPSIAETATEMVAPGESSAQAPLPVNQDGNPPWSVLPQSADPIKQDVASGTMLDEEVLEETFPDPVTGGDRQDSKFPPAASTRAPSSEQTVHVVVGSPADLASAGDHIPKNAVTKAQLGRALELASESPSHFEIHLFINGPVDVNPISIVRGDMTIRASDGFWPVLRFAPQAGDPAMHLTSMIQLFGGQLTLQHLHLLFDVPDELSPNWSLFRLEEPRNLSLHDCWITVRNGGRQMPVRRDEVTVLDLSNSPTPSDAAMDGQMTRPSIDIRNCFIRGQTSLLRTRNGAALDFSLDNCLIAIRDTLAAIEGSPQSQHNAIGVTLTLRDVTLFFDDNLLTARCDSQTPYLPPIQLRCENAILATNSDGVLVRQTTSRQQPNDISDALDVTIQRVYYEGIGTFWEQLSLGPDPFSSQTLLEMEYPQWAQWWPDQAERKGGHNLLDWAAPWDAARPYHNLRPRDFYVSDPQQPDSPDELAGSMGNQPSTPVGCQLHELAPQPYLLPAQEL